MNSSHGILLINKSIGVTSHDVVKKISHKLGKKIKVGHAGTLDPFAEGLLIVCIGEATKLSNYLMEGKKSYLAELKLGEATDTLDKDGVVTETDKLLNEKNISIDDFKNISTKFIGLIKQKIPKYSAAKINGKKGYEYARAGIEIEMPEKEVEIFAINIKNFQNNILSFEVECGSGTFIRQLGCDLANEVKTIGHLISLKRTMSCGFNLDNAIEFNTVNVLTKEEIAQKIISFNDVAEKITKTIEIHDDVLMAIKNANKKILIDVLAQYENGKYFLVSNDKKIISLIEKVAQEEVNVLRGFYYGE